MRKIVVLGLMLTCAALAAERMVFGETFTNYT